MFPRSSNCSAITNLSFPIKAESLQVHGSDSRAIKALSFYIKDSMGERICQAKANEKQKSYVQVTGNRL